MAHASIPDVVNDPASHCTRSDSSWSHVRSAFESACEAESVPPPAHDLLLAGRHVRVRCAGARLFEQIGRAFSHRLVPTFDTKPALTIDLWDVAHTGVPAPGGLDDTAPGMNGVIEVGAGGRVVTHRRRRTTGWLNRDAGELIAVFDSAEHVPLFDRGKPLHFLLGVWHLDQDVPLVHAGVVGRHGRGVLFPGKGGTGKSTAALSCALAGFEYVGDDTVGLERLDNKAVRAHSVYCSANVAPHHLERFPLLAPHAIPGRRVDEDKHLVLLPDLLPRPLARVMDLSAIVIPRIVPRDGGIVPASRADVLKALAPSTLLFFPGWGAPHLNFLASVVERLPGFWLEMGPDISTIPHHVAQLLEQLR
ncbi:MAG: hypothetical protein AB7I50_19325 [Vicinamibacterales bacterium]